jgi:hypothetical protein
VLVTVHRNALRVEPVGGPSGGRTLSPEQIGVKHFGSSSGQKQGEKALIGLFGA